MAEVNPEATTAAPSPPTAETLESKTPLSSSEKGGLVVVSRKATTDPSPLHHQAEVPRHNTEGKNNNDNTTMSAGEQPLGNAVSPHTTPTSSDHVIPSGGSYPHSVKSAPLTVKGKCEVNVFASSFSFLHDAAAAEDHHVAAADLSEPQQRADKAQTSNNQHLATTATMGDTPAEAELNSGSGSGGTGADSSVAAPCFSTGVQSPHYTPSVHSLPQRHKRRQFPAFDEVEGEQGQETAAASSSVTKRETKMHATSRENSSSAPATEPLAAIVVTEHNEGVAPATSNSNSRKGRSENHEQVPHPPSSPKSPRQQITASVKRTKSRDQCNREEENEAERNTLQWGAAACALYQADVNIGNNSSSSGSGKGQVNSDTARALATFSSLPEDNGHDRSDGSGGNKVRTRSPPPPKPRTCTETTRTGAAATSAEVEPNPIGSAGRASGGGSDTNPAMSLTSPRGELSVVASIGSELVDTDSGNYATTGCLDADTAVVAATTTTNSIAAAQFGGEGMLRHNPAYLASSGSASGSQGGDATIDHSTSSHFSALSRGPASLSPPYLAVDEESGELAVVFHPGELGPEYRHHRGSPNSPLAGSSTAAAAVAGGALLLSSGSIGSTNVGLCNGAQVSPSHLELNNTLEETFGTMVSTMSTTLSTTTNSVGDCDPGSPSDAHRLQVAAQMRQAILQTLGLNVGSAAGSTAATAVGTSNQSKQRSEKAQSLTSMTTSSVEAAAPSSVAPPLSPMRESCNTSTYSYLPRLPHLGRVGGASANNAGATHITATPPASSRNLSSTVVNLASSASLSTNSATSPMAAATQSRSVPPTLAALTTPRTRRRSGAEGEETERRCDGKADLLRTSMSEEGSRMLSLSVSNPFVYEDLPSCEISPSQQFNAAVKPPPNLQLVNPFHRHSTKEKCNKCVAANLQSPVSGIPTCSATTTNNTSVTSSNSASSLLPPVLKSTARGDFGLEAAMAEEESGSYSAVAHPPPLVLSPATYACSVHDSEISNPHASATSSLDVEGMAVVADAGKRRLSSPTALPLGWPSASSHRASSSSAPKPAAPPDAEPGAVEDNAAEDANSKEEEAAAPLTATPAPAPALIALHDTKSLSAADHVSPIEVAGGKISDATRVAGLEWNSFSLSTSACTRHYRGEDGVNSLEDEDTSNTAAARAPSTTPQFQIQPVCSLNFSEMPDIPLDAGSTNSHTQRDFVNNSAVLSPTCGIFAAANAQQTSFAASLLQQKNHQHKHADPAASSSGVLGVSGIHCSMASPPGTPTTTMNGDLAASTSTRTWTDDIAVTTAPTAVRICRYGDDGGQEDAESPITLQPPQRYSQLSFIPIRHFNSVASAATSNNKDNGSTAAQRGSDAAARLDTNDVDEVDTSNGRPATANLPGTSFFSPTSHSQQQQQLVPGFCNTSVGFSATVFGESVKEPGAERANQLVPDEEDDMWGEPITSTQQPRQFQQQPQVQQETAQKRDDDEFAEPAVTPVVESAERHIQFVDPTETQFIEPPSSPWANSDFFFDPDYTHMEFKISKSNENDNAGNGDRDNENNEIVDEEDAAILRAVPHFRFTHRSADAHGSPAPHSLFKPRTLSWAVWSRGAGLSRSKTNKVIADDEALPEKPVQQEGAHDAPSTSLNENDEGERAPRVFFTKERLVSRAALMEARRTALQRANNATNTEEPVGTGRSELLSLPSSAAAATNAKQPALPNTAATRLRFSLAPPPPPSAATAALGTISVAPPDFAAPVITTSSARTTGLLRKPPPTAEIDSAAVAALASPNCNNNGSAAGGESDCFDRSAEQQHLQGPALQSVTNTEPATFVLTREWCTEMVELKRHGACPPYDASTASAAATPVNVTRAVEVLHSVFGEDNLLTASTDNVEEAPEVPGATAPPVAGRLRDVDSVLQALSFTSLTQRNSAASANAPLAATPVASNVSAPSHDNTISNSAATTGYPAVPAVLEEGGYVVPWCTRTSATNNTTIAQPTASNTAAAAGAGVEQTDGESAAEIDAGNSGTASAAADEERSSLRLTRHLLFPAQHDTQNSGKGSGGKAPSSMAPISAFMGTRRLPDAPTVAQWTAREVLLVVQQEQRRMAQENESAVKTERLEDVLRYSL